MSTRIRVRVKYPNIFSPIFFFLQLFALQFLRVNFFFFIVSRVLARFELVEYYEHWTTPNPLEPSKRNQPNCEQSLNPLYYRVTCTKLTKKANSRSRIKNQKNGFIAVQKITLRHNDDNNNNNKTDGENNRTGLWSYNKCVYL